jgi:ADP-ribose pyrophosphatase YjhB (NUDIX family)
MVLATYYIFIVNFTYYIMIDVLKNPVDLLIINEQNQLLLVKREESENNFKNYWSIPGGGAEDGETLEDTLFREIKEELVVIY